MKNYNKIIEIIEEINEMLNEGISEEYSSKKDTLEHIKQVENNIKQITNNLTRRGREHDKSKLSSIEEPYFTKYTPKLKEMEYNSKEYKECLKELKPALDHHYKVNDHHPEHFSNGFNSMSLLQIIELLSDWRASVSRGKNGDIRKSIETNQKRFGYSNDIKQILLNTVKEMGW